MSSLNRLAHQLATPALSHQLILDGLRVLGFRASVTGVRHVLSVSISLDSHFHKLATIFPGSQKVLADFRRSKEIFSLLDSVPDFPTGSAIQSGAAAPYCAAIGGKDFRTADFDQYPVLGELIAFFWLVNSSIHAQPNIQVSENLATLLYASVNFARAPKFATIDYPDLFRQCPVALDDDLTKWIDSAASIFKQCTSSFLSTEDLHGGFAEACELIGRLTSTAAASSLPEAGDDDDNDPPYPSVQRGSSLSERERLTIHHNALQESELGLLSKKLRSILASEESYLRRTDTGATPPLFFEALIVALALATGRTIRGAIEFPLESVSKERINIKLFNGINWMFNCPVWQRTLVPDRVLELPLPDFLSCLSRPQIHFSDAATLEDCLPYSLIKWEDRCFLWLEKHAERSRHKIDRGIRDALARAIYSDTANSALLEWIATPIQKTTRKGDSLSHYLNPISENTIEAYSNACQKLFGKYGVRKEIRHAFVKKAEGIAISEQRRIAQIFLNAFLTADSSKDPVAYHNALARYVLMLLIVATGHRKSTTPFFFPWDILTAENLVFVCDKLTVGSEARFVPIPAWLSDLVRRYHLHLNVLANRLRPANSSLANEIDELLNGGSQLHSHTAGGKSNAKARTPGLGQFFFIGQDFSARTICTRDLEIYYAPVQTKGVRHFRRSIANSLWTQGLSGHQIAAFLGHNGDLHCFGESSAWSILEWANTVRKAQESYLSDCGWKTVTTKPVKSGAAVVGFNTPCFEKSVFSYEGRAIANETARARARQIIRDLLPAEWFSSENSKITDADVANLKEAAKERLASDPASCKKVEREIADVISKLRGVVGKGISSTLTNLRRIEPGPIEVTSSRHCAIASATRVWWVERLGSHSSEPGDNYMDRLAAIGISLIVFDAVLDRSTWKSLLTAIADHQTRSAHGCLLVRAQIERSSRGYDKSLVLSPYTAALAIGLKNEHPGSKRDDQTVKAVTTRIGKWLKSAPHSSNSLSVEGLITVFRAWWALRLPGTQYAIVTGDFSGPAPDVASECSLYGMQPPRTADDLAVELKVMSVAVKLESSSARAKINDLLRDAEGRFELKQQTSRRQRDRLLRLLDESNEHADLKALATQRPIVSAMLGFLQYLLDEGGKRVDVYRFGTLSTYFSHVNKLVDAWWDRSLDELESEDFDAAYTSLLKNSGQAGFPAWLFHKFMRETYEAPPSFVALSYKRTAVHCRSAVITTQQFKQAWNDVGMLKDDGQIIGHSRTYLGLDYQYALRSREALGLDLIHVLPPNPFRVRVERNNVRDLKTKKFALRVIRPLLANRQYQKHLERTTVLCASAPSKNFSLFADPGEKNALYSRSRINQAVTLVLRAATGNLAVVPHSMRHSAATRLAHFALRSPRSIPLSPLVENALLDEIKIESLTDCFSHGFSAWPFWVDHVSMFLGHTSVDTLLNTYWHTSHIRLAEQTWQATEDINVTVQQMSSMLGKDRTTVNKQMSRLRANSPLNNGRIDEALIAYHVRASKIRTVDVDLQNDQQKDQIRGKSRRPTVSQDHPDSWVAVDRLLCRRLADNLSLDESLGLADQFNLSGKNAAAFLETYKYIVRNYGFDFFEPPNSELVASRAKNTAGTKRGAAERERGIAAARALLSKSESFASKLDTFANIWVERTDPEALWFVVRDSDELEVIMEVLQEIGVARAQFEFASYHFDLTTLEGVLTKTEINHIRDLGARLSSGPRNARVNELGVRVGQKQGATIGDYRDTHRMALVLATIVLSNNSKVTAYA